MIPCQKCACDLFEIVCTDGVCWLACTFCGALKREDAIPVGVWPRCVAEASGRAGYWWTSLDLHRRTNADGLDGKRLRP